MTTHTSTQYGVQIRNALLRDRWQTVGSFYHSPETAAREAEQWRQLGWHARAVQRTITATEWRLPERTAS